ncbi:MAG: hypothetical protein RL021_681 [Bacteroidota bacterium]
MTAPRMTAHEPTDGQIAAFERAMLSDRLDPIAGAGWIESAGRSQQRRDGYLVEADQSDQHFTQQSVEEAKQCGVG